MIAAIIDTLIRETSEQAVLAEVLDAIPDGETEWQTAHREAIREHLRQAIAMLDAEDGR